MISPKVILKVLPWFLLIIITITLYITNHWPFRDSNEKHETIIESSVILNKIESLGKLELVKYNFKEVFEYRQLSDGKIIGNSILNNHSYEPDLSVVLVASGEAVGCIDLTKINHSDINTRNDSIILTLPPPELCYQKLDLANTKIHSFTKESWWSKLFSDEQEKTEILQLAYQQAEIKLREAAIESGIFQSTNENAEMILKPLLEEFTGYSIIVITSNQVIELNSEL